MLRLEADNRFSSMEDGEEVLSSELSSVENSEESVECSSSFSDLMEDASSSSSSSSSSSAMLSPKADGPLNELSDLMSQLPVKRGLSKFYEGKSQSFTSLASVKSIEDLAKKENLFNYKYKMKSCKSYTWGFDASAAHNKSYSPKPTISKKLSKSSSLSPSILPKRSSSVLYLMSCNQKL